MRYELSFVPEAGVVELTPYNESGSGEAAMPIAQIFAALHQEWKLVLNFNQMTQLGAYQLGLLIALGAAVEGKPQRGVVVLFAEHGLRPQVNTIKDMSQTEVVTGLTEAIAYLSSKPKPATRSRRTKK